MTRSGPRRLARSAPQSRCSPAQPVCRRQLPARKRLPPVDTSAASTCRAARPAARRLRPGRPVHRPVLRGAGQHVASSSCRPISITSSSNPAGRRRASGCRTTTPPRRRSATTSTACGTPTSSTTSRSTSATTRFPNGVDRQDRHLQHGGAAARQDRRLRRLEEARDVEDRREAEGSERCRSASTPSSIPALIRKVEGIVRDMLKEKGFQFAEVTHEIKEIPGGPKLVHLTFHMDEGPKVKIRSIDFIGNKAIADRQLKAQMKENKEGGAFEDFGHLWTWIASKSATAAVQGDEVRRGRREGRRVLPRSRLHPRRVGEPELKVLGDSDDKKTRCIQLRDSGHRGRPLQGRQLPIRRQHGREDRVAAAALQAEDRRLLQPEKSSAKGSTRRGRSTAPAATWSSPAIPDFKSRDEPAAADPEVPAMLKARRTAEAEVIGARRSST